MNYKELKWPGVATITARTSTIRSQFIRAIIPHIKATDEEYRKCLEVLGQDPGSLTCSYCGIPATEWDHFRPIVKHKQPTGFVTDIYNLVPACGKCNQSKSGADWNVWIRGNARHVPKNGAGQEQRIARLEAYDTWSLERTHRLDDSFLRSADLLEYMASCENLISSFAKYQEAALLMKETIAKAVESKRSEQEDDQGLN